MGQGFIWGLTSTPRAPAGDVDSANVSVGGAFPDTHGAGFGGVLHLLQGHGWLFATEVRSEVVARAFNPAVKGE
jgi:hypothetical protein